MSIDILRSFAESRAGDDEIVPGITYRVARDLLAHIDYLTKDCEWIRATLYDLHHSRSEQQEQIDMLSKSIKEYSDMYGDLESERNWLRKMIGQWAESLQWADGLTKVVEEMRQEAEG